MSHTVWLILNSQCEEGASDVNVVGYPANVVWCIFSEFSRSILSSNSIEDSFDKLTEELDSVLNDTINVIEFNKCLVPDDECYIPAECVESINGKSCECTDMGTGSGMSCVCSKS